jgi:flagellar biosynthesis GTPase FlhF
LIIIQSLSFNSRECTALFIGKRILYLNKSKMIREIGVRMDSKKLEDLEKSIKRAKERDIYDYMVKIIIVGDSGVGKTNIISRFCAKEGEVGFKDYHVATIGVDFTTKII